MGKNSRRGRNRHDWKNQNAPVDRPRSRQASSKDAKIKEAVFQRRLRENILEQQKRDEAIRALKTREVFCPICGRRIEDMSSAMADKTTGNPSHFECILEKVNKSESLGTNEKIAYIGQGRFAVLHYENPHDVRTFKIVKTIEWEPRDSEQAWRTEMSGLYSQVL
ncbi:MAG: hypothetical protein J6I73_06480 [Treponema sp.]|nr:hypothetical protein [Treponema sp.]